MLRENNIKSKQGFTIIEVVLVLAVAGLIFLMVFIALPSLQRSQRDTQRRQDLSRALTAVSNYQANNKNRLPDFTRANFIEKYLEINGDTFEDPSGDPYEFNKSYDANNKLWGGEGYSECVIKTGATNNECDTQAPQTQEEFTAGKILALVGATCDGEIAVKTSGAKRVALLMKLEGGGVACINN